MLKDVHINKIQVSYMVCSDENKHKYLIGYKDDDHKPLRIMLPKTSTYVRSYGKETKWMNFLSKDDNL